LATKYFHIRFVVQMILWRCWNDVKKVWRRVGV